MEDNITSEYFKGRADFCSAFSISQNLHTSNTVISHKFHFFMTIPSYNKNVGAVLPSLQAILKWREYND